MIFPNLPRRSNLLQQWLGHQSSALVRLCAAIVALVLCAAITDQVMTTMRAQSEITKLQIQIATVQAKTAQLMSSTSPQAKTQARKTTSDLATTEDQRRGLNTVIRQLNTPWQDLFDQLEKTTPTDIALISIEPDAKRATIRLVAEAKRLETLLTYTSDLQQQGVFSSLTYSKHETNDQDSNKPVRLTFELDLRMPQRLSTKAEVARP
jgi:septal ring factor EnvC (AmiA/AmiB activator)